MEYKLIALDMDGTLLNSQKQISKENVEAINNAIAIGKHVVLSTGRSVSELKDFKEELANMKYGILESGALNYDFVNKKSISTHLIEKEDVLKIIEIANKEDVMIHIFVGGESLAEYKCVDKMVDFGVGIYKSMFQRTATMVEDIFEFASTIEKGAEKINIYHKTPESRDLTLKRLEGMPFTFVFAEGTSIEISPNGVSKGTGLKEICNYLGITAEECICVGDADNDLEILKTAGLSIAMENANDNVKKIADVVVTDNDHDGVKEAIEKYLIKLREKILKN